jgi:hypothetical protein
MMVYYFLPVDELDPTRLTRIYRLTAEGQVANYIETTLEPYGTQQIPHLAGILLPAPLPLDLAAGIVYPLARMLSGQAASYGEALRQTISHLWPSLLLAHLLAAVLAWLCYRRQVLYAADSRSRVVWPVLVFLFGLPGWIGYRYHRAWPQLDPCPDCGALVPQDREQCARCSAEFPLPLLLGTEIVA